MRDESDQQRFQALLREHRGIVFKVAGIYARGPEESEDLAQEIAAQCWRSFARFDERRAKFSTWMYRVALNVAISHGRRRKREMADHIEPLETLHLEAIGADPSEQANERVTELRAFIADLDELNRALILLYLEECRYSEIARVLGISETNVATKISRIKQTVRSRMAEAQTWQTESKNGTR